MRKSFFMGTIVKAKLSFRKERKKFFLFVVSHVDDNRVDEGQGLIRLPLSESCSCEKEGKLGKFSQRKTKGKKKKSTG